jgi:desulfoferrodoxin (superoxide reductase-like protein)
MKSEHIANHKEISMVDKAVNTLSGKNDGSKFGGTSACTWCCIHGLWSNLVHIDVDNTKVARRDGQDDECAEFCR